MTSPPHFPSPWQISDSTAGSRAGKKRESSLCALWKFPQSHGPPWYCKFFPSELQKGNTWKPAHFLPSTPGTNAIMVGIHLHPFEINPWTHTLSLHFCKEELVQGQCPGESLVSREAQAGVAVVARKRNTSTLLSSAPGVTGRRP